MAYKPSPQTLARAALAKSKMSAKIRARSGETAPLSVKKASKQIKPTVRAKQLAAKSATAYGATKGLAVGGEHGGAGIAQKSGEVKIYTPAEIEAINRERGTMPVELSPEEKRKNMIRAAVEKAAAKKARSFDVPTLQRQHDDLRDVHDSLHSKVTRSSMDEEVEQIDEAVKTKKEKLKALLYRNRSNVRELGKGAGLTAAQKAAARKAIANEEVELEEGKYASTIAAIAAQAYEPKVGDKVRTRKGGQIPGKVEKIEGNKVYFRHPEGKLYATHSSNLMREEVALDEMDKSQPSSSRGAEGLALGKKADPVKTDKVKSDALKLLQKQYKKVKEEVEQIDELKKKTLQSYKSKAQNEIESMAKDLRGKEYQTVNPQKIKNRASGIKLATAKLKKEEVESVNEDQAADWQKVQSMEKGSMTGGKDAMRTHLKYLNAVHAHQKKHGLDTVKTKKKIEDINRTLVQMDEEVEQINEAGALMRKLVPGLGRIQAASKAEKQRDLAKSFAREVPPKERGDTNPSDGYHHPNTSANRHWKRHWQFQKIATKQKPFQPLQQKEEVEQVDEVTKQEAEKALGGEVKTRSANEPKGKLPYGFRRARNLARKAMRAGKSVTEEKLMNRGKKLAKAIMAKQPKREVAQKMGEEVEQVVEQDETMEKVEMAQTQLHFICYAANEIIEFVKMGGEVEEWYQNKLSKVHSDMESLHSYIEGEKRRTGMVKEEEEQIDEKAPPGAKYERMVKHIKKGYAKGGLTPKEKSIAYATAWKAYGKKNEEVVTEAEGTVAVTPKEKALAAHHGDPKKITYGDVIKARLKSAAAKKMGK